MGGTVVLTVGALVVVGAAPGEPLGLDDHDKTRKTAATKPTATIPALVRSRWPTFFPGGDVWSLESLLTSLACQRSTQSAREYPENRSILEACHYLPVWRRWKRRRFVIVRSWVRVPPPAPTRRMVQWLNQERGGGSPVRKKEKTQATLTEFRAFILRGNVVDLAVAVAVGASFTAVITSLVAAFITPIIGALFAKDFAHLSFNINGSKFQYGLFVNALLTFLITATAVFFFVVKPTQHLLRRFGLTQSLTKAPCPRCLTDIPIAATRCASCTSKLEANWATPSE